MRIILFGTFIDYQIQLSNALVKENNSVLSIILANKLSEDYLGNVDKRVNLHLLGKGKSLYDPTSIIILKELVKTITEFNPDIIHLQLGQGIVFLTLLPLLTIYPLVSTFHDAKLHIGENSKWFNFTRYWIRKCSNRIIVHGDKLKECMINEFKLSNEKVHAIPIGEHEVAPFKKYERDDLKEDHNLILFFGRIYKYKGLEYLIKAEPLISKKIPDVKIIIAGIGEDFKKYEKMIRDIDNFIIYNRYISYKEGAELFQRCNIVVLPYIEASQSGVIMTAYGFKKPVVVTNVGSIPEVVDNGLTGIIVPPKNSVILAESIIKLLRNDDLRRKMGENGYKKLKKDLSWNNIANKTIDVYYEAINSKKK